MIVITLTEDGFTSEVKITDSLFKSSTSNTIIKVICKPAEKISKIDLMNNVCVYLNSFINIQVLTHHVILDSSEIADLKTNRISELIFQVYW